MGNVSDEITKKLSEDEGEEVRYLYTVDLESIKLSFGGDEENSTWIQAMPLGTWMHPTHGSIVISKDRVKRFADNINNRVRDHDLDIDYDHKSLTTEAAGWVKAAKVVTTGPPKQRGLHVLVEWTEEALAKIKSKAFRFFSPEFRDQWKHPATGVVHKDVLFGGALTNRPFLTNILPINLSELISASETDSSESEEDMDRTILETLAGNLGVEFTSETTDAELTDLVTAATAERPDPDVSGGENNDAENDVEEELEPVLANEADLVKLAEENPIVAALLSEREQTTKRLQALEITNRLSEARVQLNEVGTDSVKLSPAVKEQLAGILVNVSKPVGDKLVKVLNEIAGGNGTVQLGEVGRLNDHGSDDSDAGVEFDKKVKQLMEGNEGLTFSDAVVQVSLSEPELAEQYRQGSYAFKED